MTGNTTAADTKHAPFQPATSAKCSVFIGTSIDGFIARRDGGLDFLPAGGGEEHGYSAFIASVDAVVMGRETFDTVLSFDRWPFHQPVIVMTTRPCESDVPPGAQIEFMAGEPSDIMATLEARGIVI